MTDQPQHRYTADFANTIEPAWQDAWASAQTFVQPNPGEANFDPAKPKFYCLDMFPYPSGAGLHVGHPEGYTATDILCRYKRMTGHNVLHPMGWDAFGLPAEQYAIQTGVHPEVTTKSAIDNFRRQLQRFGFCYDWSREFGTIDPDYYTWTQWIFVKIYETWYDEKLAKGRPIAELVEAFETGERAPAYNPDAAEVPTPVKRKPLGAWASLDAQTKRDIIDSYRLAYIGEQTVNWCPKLGTALANEEVIDGRSERGGHPVLRKPLRQWMFRITAYAERLLAGLADVDWPESTRTQQTSWIGRSEGAEIDFELVDAPGDVDHVLRVYTTRPDTIFGATYMVVAPEHPLVDAALASPAPETDASKLRAYVDWARNRSDVERQESKEKTGCFTGVYATNPATGERIPVWTADYVLMGYGFGAIMAVPAHDERDFEFAETFGLSIVDVVYTRPRAAMAYFAEHATEAERRPEQYAGALADFIGWVVSNDAKPSEFEEKMATIRSRRGESTATAVKMAGGGDGEPGDDAGSVGTKRGSTQIVWLDAIESLGLTEFETLADRVARRAFCADERQAESGAGFAVNSSNDRVSLDGLPMAEAKERAVAWLESEGIGSRKVNFKLRDWLFSRQRYWGEPFPIVFDDEGNHHAVSVDKLPVELPPLADYQPIESEDPTPLLGKATDWLETTAGEAGIEGLPSDARVRRETNTMPGWAGSCWYYLRYCDPRNGEALVGAEAERYWMGNGGVDLYIGGAEHAVLHLLYARFWHKVLFDLGHVSTDEPFAKLFHQGLILSHAYQRSDRSLVPIDEVEERNGGFVEVSTGDAVTPIVAKMSKSLKNVVNPDDVIAEYGADTFRLYEMYMGPLEQSKPWDTRAIEGMYRFLRDAWRMCIDESTGGPRVAEHADAEIEKRLHRVIAKVGEDIEGLSFNTAIAAMIEFKNACAPKGDSPGTLTMDQAKRFAQILAPFAPHLGEELWSRLGGAGFVSDAPWPEVDASMLVDDEVEVPVQVMGKVRAKIMVPADADAKAMEAIAMADERVQELLAGKTVRKVIAVPGRMVNIVAN